MKNLKCHFRRIFLSILTFFAIGVAHANTADTQQVHLMISVDWEGFSLEDHNLESFKKFRDDYPEVKIVHFLNAAYFLAEGADPEVVKKKISSVIRPGDELGLHIHALEPLLKAAGVEFRETETFWGRSQSEAINGMRGHDVPLTLFTEQEMRKLIRTSVKILNKNGFNNLKSFRAGGWSASPEVLSALVAEGFEIDSSAVTSDIVKLVTGTDSPLYKNIVNKLWKETSIMSTEAYPIKTAHGVLREVPNNFGLADYISGKGVFLNFKKLIDKTDFNSGKPINVHYGFHQETATQFIGEVRVAVDSIHNYIQSYRIELRSKTFEDYYKNQKSGASCGVVF
jgi:hypothetical protein